MKRMRKVAVIGGAGFIGTRLCHLFADENVPFCIVDKNKSFDFPERTILVDIRDKSSLASSLRGCDIVINLAAEHRDDVRPVSLYDEVNVDGARNLCEAMNELGINRLIFTSSVAVYGFASPNTGEDGKINPFNDYGRTKYAAEAIYRGWQGRCANKRSLAIIRPTVVFGERNRGNVFNLLKQISSGAFVMVGKGSNYKSMAYVGNVVAFLRHMMEVDPGEHICNYVDKPDIDMNNLVRVAYSSLGKPNKFLPRLPYFVGYGIGGMFDVISRVTGRRFPVSRIRVKKFCATTQFATSSGSFGFEAPFTLQEGLERTLRAEFGSEPADGPLFYSE